MTLLQAHSDNAEARAVSNSRAVKGAVTQQYAREKTVLAPQFGYAERGYQVNPTTATAGGTAVPANASPHEAFQLADANYEVEKRPLWSGNPEASIYEELHGENYRGVEGDMTVVDSHRAIHRTDTGQLLGVVGQGYVPAQNSSLLHLFDYLREDATIDNILLIRGGRKVFVTASIHTEDEVVSGDPVRRYLHAFNSHDGTGSLGVFFSDMRMVCANQLAFLTGKGAHDARRSGRGLVCKHSKSVTAFAKSLPQLVNIERQTFTQTIEQMRALSRLTVTPDMIRQVLETTYAKQLAGEITDHETGEKRAKNLLDLSAYGEIASNFRGPEGIGITGMKGVEGTAYGLFNAITQFETHSNSRLKNETEAARVRLESLWGGAGAERIETARKQLLALV